MRGTADLRRRILNRTARIVVIGQGYVGRVARLRRRRGRIQRHGRRRREPSGRGAAEGRMVVAGVDESLARSAFATGRLAFSTSAEAVAQSHLVFVCVPDPAARRDARPLLRRARLRRRRRAAGSRDARGPRVHDLPGHHRGVGQAAARDVGADGRAGLPAGLLAGADRPRQRGVRLPRRAPRRGRIERRVHGRRGPASTSSSSTRSWPCRRAAPRSSRSCWRTRSAT